MSVQRVALIGFGVLLAATTAIAGLRPQAASPGDPSKVVLIGDTCPTFSWAAAKGVTAYELVVYALEGGDEAEPLLRQSISGAALSWTPSLDRCLERGGRYAWSVRALVRATAGDWSVPSLFEVASGTSQEEFETALAVVRTYLEEHGSRGGPEPAPARPRVSAPPAPSMTRTVPRNAGDEAAAPTSVALVPEPAALPGPLVSLVTEGRVAVGTTDPLADLHIVGTPTSASILLGPDTAHFQDSEIFLAEDNDGTYGMKLRYDGSTNLFEIWGHQEGVDHGPWLKMARDTGTTTFLGPLVGIKSDPPCFNNTHRFVDCGNGTMTDTDTGIIWLKDANCFGQHDYATANNKAADLYDGAADDCGLSDGSRAGDWRLATFYDWTTILKASCDDPPRLVGNETTTAGCYSDNGWASQVQGGSYWSSTSHGTTGVDRGCVATPNVGTQVCGTVKTLTLHVWPVRGGRWDPP